MPKCPVCQSDVDVHYSYCPNCGTRLAPASPAVGVAVPESGPVVPQQPPKRHGVKLLAAVIIILVLVAISVLVLSPAASPAPSRSYTPTSCLAAGAPTTVSAPAAYYDVQEAMVFTESYTQLAFNVTAVAQCDAYGYGPSYLLNGLTNNGFWYQVGINWNWPFLWGGYTPGFGFVTESWAPGGLTRAPSSVPFSGTVNPGDTIELSLSFSGGRVIGTALDLNTSARGSMSYPAAGASTFIGSQDQSQQRRFSFATQGYFTGLMTEWYHVNATGNGPGQKVTFSEDSALIESATLGVSEWNLATSVPSSVFSDVANGGNPVVFAQPNQLQQYVLNGFPVSADAREFVTGTS